MSSVDKIFKDGLGQKGMPYDEASWVAMEDILDAKPGFVARYKYALLTLLLMVSSVTIFLATRSIKTAPQVVKSERVPGNTEQHSGQATFNESESPKVKDQLQAVLPKVDDDVAMSNTGRDHRDSHSDIELLRTRTSRVEEYSGEETNVPGVPNEPSRFQGHESDRSSKIPASTDPLNREYVIWSGDHVQVAAFNTIPALQTRSGVSPKRSNVKSERVKAPLTWFVSPYMFYQTHTLKHSPSAIKEQEFPVSYWGRGVEIGIYKGNWKLASGIQRTRIVQRTKYLMTSNELSFDTSLHMVEVNYAQTPSGNQLALLEERVDTTITPVESACANCKAEMTYLSLPLQIGYEWGRTRWRFGLQAGAQLLMLQSAVGNYAVDPNADVVYEELSSTNQLSAQVAQVDGGVFARHRLNSSVSIWSAYTSAYSLGAMLSVYDQKIQLHQFRFGLQLQW